MDDFWAQRMERAKAQPNLLEILIRNSQATQTTESQAPVQPKTIQAKSGAIGDRPDSSVEQRANKTGMPDALKVGVENLSGYSLDDVRVHYNSPKPAQLQALAYTQGAEIHIAPGQEKHLPHEAWHVVQQMQGRVKPTMQVKGMVNVNDDVCLEKEAEVIGLKALQRETKEINSVPLHNNVVRPIAIQDISRRVEQPNQKIHDFKTNTVQRKITVGILKYDAKQAETRVRSTNIEWKDVYRQVLTSLDAKDERFRNIEELNANLELNGNYLEAYKNGAEGAWEIYSYKPGTGDSLHDLAYRVIVNAITDKSAIKEMSYDKIFKYTPETQLAYCLWECRDDTEDVLALCFYTSYFYEPLNKYFRGQSNPDESTDFGKLVLKTAEVLRGSYENEEATEITDKRYKLELKSGWIHGNEDSINFPSLTSTHPNLDGVRGMWGDIANGTFGDYDNFALLTFEGTAKTKRPVKKYFPGESEDLMGPGGSYYVSDRYIIEGFIPGIGHKGIRVFRLSNRFVHVDDGKRLTFADVVPTT